VITNSFIIFMILSWFGFTVLKLIYAKNYCTCSITIRKISQREYI